MILSITRLLTILAIHYSLCLAQFEMVPFGDLALRPCEKLKTTYNNTWTVESLTIDVQNASLVGIGFSLYRTVFRPCDFGPNTFFGDVIPCGWVNMNFPISCYAGIADNGFEGAPEIENPKALKAKEQWYSCNLYPRGIEGERNIPAETKQWIKWRLAQVDVSGGDDSNVLNAASNISFRSVNVEFKSAIPQPTPVNSTSVTTPMVKVFTTLFGMENWHNGACNTGSYKLPGQYYCSPKPSELVTCGVLGAAACQFSVNVTDETMPTSKFKELVR